MLAKKATLTLVLMFSAVATAWGQNGTCTLTSGSGVPSFGGTTSIVNLTVTVAINPGVAVDSFAFGVSATPNNGGPAITFNNSNFIVDPGLVNASLNRTGTNNTMAVSITGNNDPNNNGAQVLSTGTVVLGTLKVPIPTSALNGETYAIAFTGCDSADSVKNIDYAFTFGPNGAVSVTQTPVSFAFGSTNSGGNSQTGTVGMPLTNPLAAVVKDVNGVGIPGYMVAFSVQTGGAMFSNSTGNITVTTDSTGTASTVLTLGTVAGTSNNTVNAVANGTTGLGTLNFAESAMPDIAKTISAVATTGCVLNGTGPNATCTGAANTAINGVSVSVVDKFSNPVSGQAITFTPTGGTVGGGTPTTGTNGIATINWTFGSSLSGQSMTAGLTTNNANNVAAVTFTGVVQLQAGSTVAAGNPATASGTVGQTSTNICAVVSTNNIPVVGATVNFSVPNGNTSVFTANGVSTATSGANTQACTTLTLTQTASSFNVTASVSLQGGGTASATIPVTAAADIAKTISAVATTGCVLNGTGPNATCTGAANTAINGVSVSVVDKFSNPVSGQAITFTPTLGTVGGGTPTTGTNGIATINWTFGSSLSGQSMTAGLTTNNANNVAAVTFTGVVQLQAGSTVAAGNPATASGTVGQTSTNICAVVSTNNIPVVGATVNFSVPNGNTSVFTANGVSTATSGANTQACTTLTLTQTASSFNVTASVSLQGGGTASATIPVTAAADIAKTISAVATTGCVLNGTGPNATCTGAANTAINGVSVSVVDKFSNPVSGQAITFTPTLGTVGGGTPTTGTNGIATINWTFGSSISGQSMNAGLTTNNANNVAAVTFTAVVQLSAGSTVAAVLTGANAPSAVVTTAINSICAVVMSNNNTVQGATVTFGAGSSGATLNPSNGQATTGANGQACIAITLGQTAGSLNLTAQIALVGGSNASAQVPFTAMAGALANLVYVSGNTQAGFIGSPLPSPLVVKATDQYGNGVSGVQVTFNVTSGGGSFSGPAGSSIRAQFVSARSSSPALNTSTIATTGATGTASAIWTIGSSIGANTATASISSPSVTVNFSATGGETMTLTPTQLAFTNGFTGPLPIMIGVNGGAVASWSISGFPGWVMPSATSGTTPATVAINVNTTGLAPGSYGGTLAVSVAGATNSPQAVSISLVITASGSIGLSQNAMSFNGTVGGATLPTQQLLLSASSLNPNLPVGITTSTANGINWLSALPSSGTTPLAVTVSVTPGVLAAGTYGGTITITSAQINPPTQTVAVTLILTSGQPVIQLSPTALNFSAVQGGANPASQTVNASNSGSGTLVFSATEVTASNGNWLAVTGGGSGTAVFTVSVDSSQLTAGIYAGTISVAAPGAVPTPQAVPVTVTVTAPQNPPTLAVNPTGLLFTTAAPNAPPPPAQTFTVQNIGGGGPIGFTITPSTTTGGNWLFLTNGTGTTFVTPAVISVSATPGSLAQGGYNGSITLNATTTGVSNGTIVVPAGLSINAPAIEPGGLVNAAIFNATASSGSIVSIFGVNLCTTTQSAPSTPLPVTLGGTQVLVNGVAVPLFYVSPTQINAQIPEGVTGNVTVTVVSGTTTGVTTTVAVTGEAPGIFVASGTQGAVLDFNYTPNSPTAPATVGSVIQIYATGLGATNPPLASGQAGSVNPPFNLTVDTVTVQINGQNATVVFSGAAPGFVGLFQVNAIVPAGTPAGNNVSLQLSISGQQSNSVTICVAGSDPNGQ